MGRLGTQRLRPTRPPGRSGPLDRTAGGIGGAAPASLDLYGQSRSSLFRYPLPQLIRETPVEELKSIERPYGKSLERRRRNAIVLKGKYWRGGRIC